MTLNCEFQGQQIIIEETLYRSVRDYYESDPKKSRYSAKNDYRYFTQEYPEDKTIRNLTAKIKDKAQSLGFSSDRTLDLVTCFVQNIPYDEPKAKKILSKNEGQLISSGESRALQGRFPYETLYDNLGICTDKSFLEAALARELGYGVSLLAFDAERHMAAGIRVPGEYSSFGTGYAFVETTNVGYKAGQIPVLDDTRGGAKKSEIEKISEDFIPEIPQPSFSNPSAVISVFEGREYQRIIEITENQDQLKKITLALNEKHKLLQSLKAEIDVQEIQVETQRKELAKSESGLEQAESDYNLSLSEESYHYYTQQYESYLRSFENYQNISHSFSRNVDNYNAEVVVFNSLIDDYNYLIKTT